MDMLGGCLYPLATLVLYLAIDVALYSRQWAPLALRASPLFRTGRRGLVVVLYSFLALLTYVQLFAFGSELLRCVHLVLFAISSLRVLRARDRNLSYSIPLVIYINVVYGGLTRYGGLLRQGLCLRSLIAYLVSTALFWAGFDLVLSSRLCSWLCWVAPPSPFGGDADERSHNRGFLPFFSGDDQLFGETNPLTEEGTARGKHSVRATGAPG